MLQSKTLRPLSVLLLVAVLVFAQGCDSTESDDIPTGPPVTIDNLIEDGWQQLNDGEVNDALFTFTEAANADAANLEAYLGLGYAYALNADPIGAQLNLGNVLSLGAVMAESGEIEMEYANTLFAEACAGRASVALSTQDYQECIDEALAAEGYWDQTSNDAHRWLPGFALADLAVMEANAWYGLGEYGEALMLLDQVSSGLIDEMLAAGTLIEETETLNATMLEQTASTGVAELQLSNENLVLPLDVNAGGIEYSIEDYVITGNQVHFMGNPIPTPNDQYTVTYYYTNNFGAFLIELRDVLDSMQ